MDRRITVSIVAILVIGFAAFAICWLFCADIRYIRVYHAANKGDSMVKITSRFAALHPWDMRTRPYRAGSRSPYPNAAGILLITDHKRCSAEYWCYQFFLDSRGRVIAKHRYRD